MPLFLRNREFPSTEWPVVMGILNVTPDSFSDGGEFADPDAAVERAVRMVEDGASIIDVGPESTRPGSVPVSADEQIRRAIPVISRIRERLPEITISTDTRLADVAERAIEAGADMVNDVSALRDDSRLAEVVARSGVSVVLMHRRGTSADMQQGGGPYYENVIAETGDFLRERAAFAVAAGVNEGRIILDPGLGFGKRLEDNLRIMGGLAEFVALGFPLLVGASRKRFLGAALEIDEPKDRVAASVACALIAAEAGAAIVRAHDVKATVQTLCLSRRIRASRAPGRRPSDGFSRNAS